MSSILKVIDGLQNGPWSFWKFCLGPFSPSSSSSALSRRRPTVPRRPPPLWAGRRPTPVSPPPHASPLDPWTHFPRALELPPFATPPRTISRPPPRRRRGEPAAPPQDVNSRAPQHLKKPEHSILCALSLAPRSGSPEHYRLRHYRPSSELAADSHPPPFPPAINPANRSASLSRSSLTSSRRLSSTRNPSRRAPP